VAPVFAEVDPPEEDLRLPRLLADLGRPGIVDMHVHLLPERMQARVWSHFDAAAPLVGQQWPIRYRWPVPSLPEHLRRMGVRRFPTLPYAHRPGMAAEHPDVVPTLTLYPEPAAAQYVASALERGARAAKVHLQVGDFDPGDAALDQVWGILGEAGVPVVVHAGSGPVPGRFTGVEPLATVLRRFPSLVVVIAHLGAPETAAFLDLVQARPHTYLDTTLAFTPFMDRMYRPSRELVSRLADFGDRIVFGSDLPSIPHSYAHAVLHDNGARLLEGRVAP
jgi:hypothetical protein